MNRISDLNLLLDAAKRYRDNLLNKNLIIIYKNRELNKCSKLDIPFMIQSFLHLISLFKKVFRYPISPYLVHIKINFHLL